MTSGNHDLYLEEDYRNSLKHRMQNLQEERPGLTWRKIAAEVPIQYTYLSRALNDERTHLNEDHLFVVCRALKFFPSEIDFLLTQRSLATAGDPERKDFLVSKLREARTLRKLSVEGQSFDNMNDQIRYLFEPLCLVVHMALDIPVYRSDPSKLCAALSITVGQLREILRVLSRNDYIELESDGLNVRKIKSGKIHFGPEHFLMRYHLSMVKSQMIARIARTAEQDRFGFLVTLTMDEASFMRMREEFQQFLSRAEAIAAQAKSENVYQMSFDLFRWL
jgi:hypothetical protein